MADQLLSQIQDLFEGQIVNSSPSPRMRFHTQHLVSNMSQDFKGQKKTELITTIALSISGVRSSFFLSLSLSPVRPLTLVVLQLLAFLIGYIQEDIHLVLWIGLAGTLLTFFMVVPPWPMYNEDPESWLPQGTEVAGTGVTVGGKKVN